MSPLEDSSLTRALGILDDLAHNCFVVGGAIRDALSGDAPFTDLDVAVQGDGCEVARRVADLMGSLCSFVPLDPARGTARLVFREEGSPSVDISTFRGSTIEEDLLRRDFTINAMGVSARDFLTQGVVRLVDPCDGATDLRARRVRVCSPNSFADDPLRVLRAFRFAAALNFAIHSDTLSLIPPRVNDLESVAGERIRDELFAILATPSCFPILQHMDAIGIMDALCPEFRPMRGCEQNEYHHLDVWRHSLEAIHTMELFFTSESACLGEFQFIAEAYAEEELVAGRPRKALLKLAALFHDAGKPHTRFVDESGKVRFFGHEKESGPIFEQFAARLRLSSRETLVGASWIQGHMRPIVLFSTPVTRRMIYRLWRIFGEEILGLFILFLADLAASRGPARATASDESVYESVRSALAIAMEFQKTPPAPLVNGRDLMAALALSPGPKLGNILSRLAEMQASGDITTREEALAAAKQLA